MINDGWPNAIAMVVTNMNGLERRIVLVAMETIQKDSQICFSYGPHHNIKLGPYIELRKQEMLELFECLNNNQR